MSTNWKEVLRAQHEDLERLEAMDAALTEEQKAAEFDKVLKKPASHTMFTGRTKQTEEIYSAAAAAAAVDVIFEDDPFSYGGSRDYVAAHSSSSSRPSSGGINIKRHTEVNFGTESHVDGGAQVSPRSANAISRAAGGGPPGSPGGATPPAAAAPDATLR